MNKRTQSVMTKLKPKVKAFGFNQKELKSIAAQIADNLTSEEDASDEDVNAEIETAIEAVLPILRLGQAYANRVINANKNENEENDNDEEEREEPESKSKSSKSTKTKEEKSDDEPAWFKAYRESMDKKFEAITGERIADKRKSRLEKLLKDTGAFGTRTLKSFAKMKFDNDDEFDEFYSEVEEDLKSLNQERANAGLAKLGAPATGGSGKKDEKQEVLSEDEIKAIAKM